MSLPARPAGILPGGGSGSSGGRVTPNASAGAAPSPYFFDNFSTKSVSFSITGAAVNALGFGGALFPFFVKIGELSFPADAGLISLNLSSSITVETPAATAAILIAMNQGNRVSTAGINRQFINHLAATNSVAGLPNPSTRTNAMTMGPNSYYKINSGQVLNVYASAPNAASCLLSGIVTAFWFPIQSS